MTGPAVVSLVLAGAWVVAGLVVLRRSDSAHRLRLATTCGGLALAHGLAAARPEFAPLLLGAWTLYALAVPDGLLTTAPRRATSAVAVLASVSWAVVLLARQETATV